MIKDITIGQYFPGNSVIHRMDARIKIIMTAVFIVMLFAANSVWGLLVGIAFTILTFIISKIPGKLMLKSLKPIVPIIIFTAILNLLFIRTGKAYFEWKFLKITDEGVDTAVFMMIRIICLIVGTSLLTYTTSPIDLTDAIERLLSPLKKIKVPVHELAMMMTIALRFIPTLMDETDKIMKAQMSRGADFESKNLVSRAKNLVPLLVPLFVSAFRRAEELAMAMEARCYRGGYNRTKMRQSIITKSDYIAGCILIIYLVIIIITRFI